MVSVMQSSRIRRRLSVLALIAQLAAWAPILLAGEANTRLALVAEVPIGSLQQAVNRQLPNLLFRQPGIDLGCGFGNCSAQLTLTRRGPVGVSAGGDALTTKIPLHVQVRLDWYKKVAFAKIRHHEDGHADLDVTAVSRLQLSPDWRLSTTTHADVRVPNARIDLPISSMSVRGVVTRVANENAGKVTGALDAKVRDSVALREAAESAMTQLAEPIRLSADPPVWLQVEARTARVGGIAGGGGRVRLPFDVEADLRALMGSRPGDTDGSPLPPLEQGEVGAPGWRADVPLVIDLPTLGHWLATRPEVASEIAELTGGLEQWHRLTALLGLQGQPRVMAVDVSARDDRLEMAVELAATRSGGGDARLRLVITGVPTLAEGGDLAGQLVVLDDARIRVAFRAPPGPGLDGFEMDETRLAQPLRLPLGERLLALRNALSAKLREVQLGDGATLRGGVRELRLRQLQVVQDALRARVLASGGASLELRL